MINLSLLCTYLIFHWELVHSDSENFIDTETNIIIQVLLVILTPFGLINLLVAYASVTFLHDSSDDVLV